ncbi:MAG: HEPN domain-containing protein [Anaerolineae bacterium]
MSDPTDPLAWAVRAEEDYVLARSALRRKKPLVYGAVFRAQQCAEKYLKALLVAQGQEFPKTHDLAALSDLCSQSNIIISVDQDALQRLAAYAVQVRYPGEDPTIEEARSALETAQAVRRYARSLLGIAA